MFSVFSHVDYKEATGVWLKTQPKEGRGLLSRMAEQAQLSAPMITQILSGEKHFSPEAAYAVAEFMGLGDEETHYYLLLVQAGRAGSHSLKIALNKKIREEQKKANQLQKKLKPDGELSEQTKQQFYADWIYSGVRNLAACPSTQTVDDIALHLRMPRVIVQKVVEFLLNQNLCVLKNGRLDVGPQITHVPQDHPLVQQHHKNWRLQGMTRMTERNDENLFFTSPLSLSKEDADLIRQKIPAFIADIRKIVGPSKSEVVRCLNIDWFGY